MSFAHRWLTANREEKTSGRKNFAGWIEEYELADREYRLRVAQSR